MGIDIAVKAGKDAGASSVSASGSIQHIVTDQERTTFNVNDASLKHAVEAYFGKAPNDAYLHSPTPWNDLYKTYGWPQVSTLLTVQKAEILGLTSTPEIVKTQQFSNDSSHSATFNVSISDSVANTVSSGWSTGGTLSISEAIEVGVDFIEDAKSTTTISYSQSWGIHQEKSQTVTVGSDSGVTVTLDPNESIVAELSASRGVLKVRITYVARLIGSAAVNYNPTFKGHHFWALDIGSVMGAAGISNAVVSTQDIEIGYYSNAKITLRDAQTKAVKAVRNLADFAAVE